MTNDFVHLESYVQSGARTHSLCVPVTQAALRVGAVRSQVPSGGHRKELGVGHSTGLLPHFRSWIRGPEVILGSCPEPCMVIEVQAFLK